MSILALATMMTAAQVAATRPIWQIHAALEDQVTVPVHGTDPIENVSGFKFTVARRPDGSLPASRLAGVPFSGIYLKLPTGKYAVYALSHPLRSSTQGVLLDPGEYLVASTASGPLYEGSMLLGGEWMSLSDQSTYFALTGASAAYTNVQIVSSTLQTRGITFFLKNRADGKRAVITASCHQINQGKINVYRRETRLTYSYAALISPLSNRPASGAMLAPGEYVVEVPTSVTRPAPYYEYLRFAIGEFRTP